MISEYQICRQIKRLLANKFSLDDFEDWLVQSSWNMHLDSDSKAQDLVWKIELSLAEYSSDYLDEAELLAELRNLVPGLHEKPNWYNREAVLVTTQSAATTRNSPLYQPTLKLGYVDTRAEVACV